MKENILIKEQELLKDERHRRSNNQFQYIRINLINIGTMLISSFIFKYDLFQKIDKNFYIGFISILSLLSLILFLMWIDDALTIAGIDKFFLYCEKKFGVDGWYNFRKRELNSTNTFQFKAYIFNIAIFISFVFPPLIAAFLFVIVNINIYIIYTFFVFIILVLFSLFYNWRKFSKDIYIQTENRK